MKSFLVLVAIIFATAVGLAVCTRYQVTHLGPAKTRYDTALRLGGVPVTSVGHRARGILAIGQVASGVMVIAQGGYGVVTMAQGGVGLLFGLGQGMAGLLVISQLGLGLVFFLGQVGGGLFCLGQGVLGYVGAGQGAATRHGMDWLRELDAEARALFSFRGRAEPRR